MTLTTSPTIAAEPAAPRRPHRRWWVAAIVAILAIAAFGVVAIIRHHRTIERYRNAAPLSCDCGENWEDSSVPPGGHLRRVGAGPFSSEVITAYPGHVQSFEVILSNDSSITQTAFGGTFYKYTDAPIDVTFARPERNPRYDQSPKSERDFTETSATIAPGGTRYMRWSIHTTDEGVWKQRSRQEYWRDLPLRVRVGSITRHEVIDLNDFAFVMASPKQVR